MQSSIITSSAGKDFDKEEPSVPWKHFFFKIWSWVRQLFKNPFKQEQKDLNLLNQVTILMNEGDLNKETIEKCGSLIRLHRITENTKARKRLEKWTKKIISTYLSIVLLLIILSAFNVTVCGHQFDLSNEVLITILSTTTVNVLGLALILMKGHFPYKEDGKQAEDSIKEEI